MFNLIDFRTMNYTKTHESLYDILFKNFFTEGSTFLPVLENSKLMHHPIDIYEDKSGLHFEISCTGLSKEDVNITVDSGTLKISHTRKSNESDSRDVIYITRNITKKSFNLGYKISSKFALEKLVATMTNGLLKISIPFAENSAPKNITIN